MAKSKKAAKAQNGMSETAVLERLRKSSSSRLLFLMERLLERKPDIESLIALLLELPSSASKQSVAPVLDASNIRDQVAAAFKQAGRGLDASIRVASRLYQIVDIGSGFAEAGQWANAQIFYTILVQEIIARYEEVEDEGQISGIIEDCVAGLVECLEVQSSIPQADSIQKDPFVFFSRIEACPAHI